MGAGIGAVFQSRSMSVDNDRVLFTSFFTCKTPYEECAQTLMRSLSQLDLSYYIEGLYGRGSWRKNCFMKAYFLRKVFNRAHDYQAIVWLDADSIIIRRPELFFTMRDVDFAVRGRGPTRDMRIILKTIKSCLKWPSRYNTKRFYNVLRDRAQFEKCHAAVLYLRNIPAICQLLEDWISVIEEKGSLVRHDQEALQLLLEKKNYYARALKLFCLPLSYSHRVKGDLPLSEVTVIQ